MTAQYSAQSFDFNIAPVVKMYLDSMEAWKKNYEAITGNVKTAQASYPAEGTKALQDSVLAFWQKSGAEVVKRFVEQQIELCRFFAGRWEQYLKLTEQLAHCNTPADMGQVQTEFLSQFANDYMRETSKLSVPAGDLASRWAAGHPA